MNVNNFLSECPVLYVNLPKELYEEKKYKYRESSPAVKGIIVEMLATLAIKRIFQDQATWPVDIYHFSDMIVGNSYIDIKTTSKSYYPSPSADRALHYIQNTYFDFSFVLVTPEKWIDDECAVQLRVHEIHLYDSKGNMKKTIPQGSHKRFA